jgi:hypothetical protein
MGMTLGPIMTFVVFVTYRSEDVARLGECQETIVLESGTGVIGAVISGENVPTYFPCTASSNGWYRLRPNDDVQRIEHGVHPTLSFFVKNAILMRINWTIVAAGEK